MEDLYLEIITPEKILYDGHVGMVEVPGAAGRFVLLRDHAHNLHSDSGDCPGHRKRRI
ncbi:hypothetical protein [Marinilabilia salmonicolor]|uniref:hypothetical protein n=1 Tax=Marinilabilia salmonicolor TaxID=989 RepID=UPI001F1D015E|nr:hypothetical protein [Marinilabilia salmonicolor]